MITPPFDSVLFNDLIPVTSSNSLYVAIAVKILHKDLSTKGIPYLDLPVQYIKKFQPYSYSMYCEPLDILSRQDSIEYWREILKILNWNNKENLEDFINWLESKKISKTYVGAVFGFSLMPFICWMLNRYYELNANYTDYLEAYSYYFVMAVYLKAGYEVIIDNLYQHRETLYLFR